jgi:glycosyltransferase involved in cell wall biosynthesis
MTRTPGPWKELDMHKIKRNPGTVRAIVTQDQSKIIATIDADISNCRGVQGDFSMFCDHPEGWDNARLIAAAPDLLEACKLLLEFENDFPEELWSDEYRDAIYAAKYAVAKAEPEP